MWDPGLYPMPEKNITDNWQHMNKACSFINTIKSVLVSWF